MRREGLADAPGDLGPPVLRWLGDLLGAAWHGRTPEEIAECERHEALLNVAFSDRPGSTLMCPYDRTLLDGSVLAEARNNHPLLVQDGETVPSEGTTAWPRRWPGRCRSPAAGGSPTAPPRLGSGRSARPTWPGGHRGSHQQPAPRR